MGALYSYNRRSKRPPSIRGRRQCAARNSVEHALHVGITGVAGVKGGGVVVVVRPPRTAGSKGWQNGLQKEYFK
jgi:hypothetical protein